MKRTQYNMLKIGLTLGALAFSATAMRHADAAWHDAYHGKDLVIHYVHLTGFGGDNMVNRDLLRTEHTACTARNKVLGKPSKSLAPGDIPAIPVPEDVEIYYSANRTLTVKQGTFYYIEGGDCTVAGRPHHTLELRSPIGRCDIDLLKKEARGQCDANAHQRASASSAVQLPAVKLPVVDMAKVPPELRAQVDAQRERLKQLPPSSSKASSAPSGVFRTIANFKCEVQVHSSLNYELCIAHPTSSFPIPAASLNGGTPGLLLEAKSPALTLGAQQVIMDLRVSQDMFALPQGVKILSSASGKS